MSGRFVLGIDVGTTGAKAMCVSDGGEILGRAYRGYALCRENGVITQDPRDWYEAVCAIAREAAGDRAPEVEAVSFSTQGGTLVLTDGKGEPVCPASSWMDGSGGAGVEALKASAGDVRGITGWEANGWMSAAKLSCGGDHGAEKVLSTVEYVNYRLTGRFACDPSNGAMQGLMDARLQDWDDRLLAAAGVRREQMPELVPSGTVVGGLTEKAAEDLGLSAGIPVISGGHDQYCAALGAGLSEPGDLLISGGTAWVLLTLTKEIPSFGAWERPLTGPGYGVISSISSAGASMEWASRLAGCSLREADEGAAAVRDAPRFYVGFGGPEGARLCGLELDHDRFAVLRAVMEGVAFEVRRRAEPFGTPAGVFVNGGASKSGVWMQILADILGRPVTVIEERDLACVGAAKLAFLGLGQKVELTFSRHDVTPIRDETARYCRWMEGCRG